MKKKHLFILSILVVFLVSCSKQNDSSTSTSTSSSSPYINEYSITDVDFYKMPYEEYCVIIHSSYCIGCKYLHNTLDNYQKNMISKNKTMVFVFDVTNNDNIIFMDDKETVISQKGNDDVYKTYFYCTPSLYNIKNNVLSEVTVEYTMIEEFLLDI